MHAQPEATPRSWTDACACALERGDLEAARASVSGWIDESPLTRRDPELWFARARLDLALGRAAEARAACAHALVLAPGNERIRRFYAVSLLACGEAAQARRCFEECDLDPCRDVDASLWLAIACARVGDLGTACELQSGVLAAHPRDADLWAVAAELAEHALDRTSAETAYRAALRLDRTHARARRGLARLGASG